jgi:sulfate permease, SulP family
MSAFLTKQAWRNLSNEKLLPGFMTGVIIVVIDVTFNISLAALIFSGPLSAYLGRGIGFLLFGTAIVALMTALFSSYPGMISVVQDAPTVMLALTIASMVTYLTTIAQPEAIYVTVVATITISTLLTAIFFLVLGSFKLGNLVRFIPSPVMGGFLAGIGWLLLSGGLEVMAGIQLSLSTVLEYFSEGLLIRWLPGLIFGVFLFIVLKRIDHYLVMPGMVVGGSLIFYLILFLSNVSIPQGIELGLLLEPFPQGNLWNLPPFASLQMVNWTAIFAQASNLAVVTLIAILGLLLNASGMELVAEREIDLNRELRLSGASNLLAGFAGSPVGYCTVSFSTLNKKLAAGSRITGILVSGLIFTALIFGAPILALFPKPLAGGLLVFIGISFLAEWLYESWFKLSRADYLIIITILMTMSMLGPLPGVGLGLLLAAVIFIVNYSQVRVINRKMTGESYRSTVDRPEVFRSFLRENGHQILILQLQGYLFFGTAHLLLDHLQRLLAGNTIPRFIILDFRRASGCDSSSLFSFERMHHLAQEKHFYLLFTHLSPAMRKQFQKGGLNLFAPSGDEVEDIPFPGERVLLFSTLDQGMEWCENRMLKGAPLPPLALFDSPPQQFIHCLYPSEEDSTLIKYMERKEVEAGHYLMRQGEASDSMAFIKRGSASVLLELENGTSTRLRTLRPGSIVGEVGYYLQTPRTASVITLEPTEFLCLSYENFDKLQREEPEVAADMHQWLARLLAERLADDTRTITALLSD